MKRRYGRFPSRLAGRHTPEDADQEDNPYIMVRVFLPKSVHQGLREVEDERRQPMSKLVAMAIDNELDQKIPFNYPDELPTNVNFDSHPYAHQAGLIVEFLRKVPSGLPVDSLILLRRQIGIEKRSEVKAAVAELLHHKMVELIFPYHSHYRYKSDYRYVRLVGLDRKAKYKNRYKAVEGESTHPHKRAIAKRFKGKPDES